MKKLLILLSICLIGCCAQPTGVSTELKIPGNVEKVEINTSYGIWRFYEITYKEHIFMVGRSETGFIHAPYCPCHQKEASNNLYNPYGQNF